MAILWLEDVKIFLQSQTRPAKVLWVRGTEGIWSTNVCRVASGEGKSKKSHQR